MDVIARKAEAVVKRHPAATTMFCTVHRYELDHLEAERDELLAALNQLRGAVEALRELRGKGRVHFGGCPWPMSHCTCKKAQAILAEHGGQ